MEARALWLGHMVRGGGRCLRPVSARGPVVPRAAAAVVGAAPILSVAGVCVCVCVCVCV